MRPPMKLLLHTMATPELSPIQALDLALSLQLDGIDIICQDQYFCGLSTKASISEAQVLCRAARERGLIIGALTPYEQDFHNNPNAPALDRLRHAIELAGALGAGNVRILAGREADNETFDI